MKLLTNIQDWGDQHHPKWLDYFRIVLGVILIWKGVAFAGNLGAFTKMMTDTRIPTALSISIIAHLIIMLHIIGGLFITIGSNTRLFCLLNLPILIVAVFYINLQLSIFKPYAELWLSMFVLFGLVCFLIEGNGVLSVEHEREISV